MHHWNTIAIKYPMSTEVYDRLVPANAAFRLEMVEGFHALLGSPRRKGVVLLLRHFALSFSSSYHRIIALISEACCCSSSIEEGGDADVLLSWLGTEGSRIKGFPDAIL